MEEYLTSFLFKEYLESHHMPGNVQAADDKVMGRKVSKSMRHSLKGKQTLFVCLF